MLFSLHCLFTEVETEEAEECGAARGICQANSSKPSFSAKEAKLSQSDVIPAFFLRFYPD